MVHYERGIRMKRKIKFIIALAMLTVLFTSNLTHISFAANASSTLHNRVIIAEGYTEDGIHYTVYLDNNNINKPGIVPCIVVSKQMSIWVRYEGNIIPSSTFYLNVYDTDYNTYMSGTLFLERYFFDNFFGDKRTQALYSGYIVGHI